MEMDSKEPSYPLTISQDNKIISVGNERFSLTFPPRYLPSKVNIISFDS